MDMVDQGCLCHGHWPLPMVVLPVPAMVPRWCWPWDWDNKIFPDGSVPVHLNVAANAVCLHSWVHHSVLVPYLVLPTDRQDLPWGIDDRKHCHMVHDRRNNLAHVILIWWPLSFSEKTQSPAGDLNLLGFWYFPRSICWLCVLWIRNNKLGF